jgi:hypothetical protein
LMYYIIHHVDQSSKIVASKEGCGCRDDRHDLSGESATKG